MTVCLLFLMPYSLLGETLHEWLGIVMFVLFVTHHVLNRKWMAAVTKGKYTPFRIVQTLIVFVMLVLMFGSMVSGVLLSNHIFAQSGLPEALWRHDRYICFVHTSACL